jgi:hypothetical protein
LVFELSGALADFSSETFAKFDESLERHLIEVFWSGHRETPWKN